MSLNKEHFDKIQRDYDQRRLDALYRNSVYLEELHKHIPSLKSIEDEISSLQVAKIKDNLLNNSSSEEQITSKIESLIEKRNHIYENNNITAEDLKPHYTCPDCQDTGYIRPGKRCHCYSQAVIDILYSQSNIKLMLNTNNFSHFNFSLFDDVKIDSATGKTSRANMRDTVEYCMKYIDEFDSVFRNLLFYGETGVGKTFITSCIAKELLERQKSVLYLSSIDFTNILTDATFNSWNTSDEVKMQTSFIYDCDLLIIDDLGTEVTNALKSSNLFNCLDKRLNMNKSTIISTNLSPELISRQYSERIFSRILGSYSCCKIFGRDLRTSMK